MDSEGGDLYKVDLTSDKRMRVRRGRQGKEGAGKVNKETSEGRREQSEGPVDMEGDWKARAGREEAEEQGEEEGGP